jgi:hypothetical protein
LPSFKVSDLSRYVYEAQSSIEDSLSSPGGERDLLGLDVEFWLSVDIRSVDRKVDDILTRSAPSSFSLNMMIMIGSV